MRARVEALIARFTSSAWQIQNDESRNFLTNEHASDRFLSDSGNIMDSIERSISVAVPITRAFEPWLNVEEWPRFLKAIREARRIDEKTFRLLVERGGQTEESVAEISLVIPERRIAWRNISGAVSSGVVCFESLPDGQTQVKLKMQYRPDAGWHHPDALAERLEYHLACFKEFIDGSP